MPLLPAGVFFLVGLFVFPVFLLPDSLLASAASLRLRFLSAKGSKSGQQNFFLVPAPKLLAAFPTAQIIAAIFGYWGFDFMLYRLLRFLFLPVFRADRWTWHVIPRPVFPHKPVFPAVPARIARFLLTMRQISSFEPCRFSSRSCALRSCSFARLFFKPVDWLASSFQPVQFAFQSF